MNNSVVIVDIQIADEVDEVLKADLPNIKDIEQWLVVTFEHLKNLSSECKLPSNSEVLKNIEHEVSIRIVSKQESKALNNQYRHKDKPTNVLSFESDLPDFIPSGFIGDLVICAQVVKDEALQQNKQLASHWAHMCVHGTLHLLAYDHITDSDAAQMETIEVEILNKLGIDDPYQLS